MRSSFKLGVILLAFGAGAYVGFVLTGHSLTGWLLLACAVLLALGGIALVLVAIFALAAAAESAFRARLRRVKPKAGPRPATLTVAEPPAAGTPPEPTSQPPHIF